MSDKTGYLTALSRKIASKSSNLLDTFIEMDLDNDGSISRSDLAISMQSMFGIRLTPRQLNALSSKFGMSVNERMGRINYSTFVNVINDLAVSKPLTSSAYGAGETLDTSHNDTWDKTSLSRLGVGTSSLFLSFSSFLFPISNKI